MSEPITAAPRGRSAVLHAVARGAGRWAVRLAVVLAGAWLGILLLGRVAAPIGPFDATVALRPLGGGATLDIPPLGALEVDAYDGPLAIPGELVDRGADAGDHAGRLAHGRQAAGGARGRPRTGARPAAHRARRAPRRTGRRGHVRDRGVPRTSAGGVSPVCGRRGAADVTPEVGRLGAAERLPWDQ